MRLYFSTDHVRNSTITNERGQVLYKVVTPFRPFFMKGTSTIWKIIPNTPPLYYSGKRAQADESKSNVESESSDGDDFNDDGPSASAGASRASVPMDKDIHAIQSDEELEDEEEDEEEEKEIIIDMQDNFAQLAQIEFNRFQSSRIRWFGLNKLGRGEVTTKDFMPSRGITRRTRIFTGPDDRSYRWNLGLKVCKLYLESDPQKPVAQYHRYRFLLCRGKRSQPGYLDISVPTPKSYHSSENVDMENYTDQELERILDRGTISPELLDTMVVTFIYVEKIRRERERAIKKDVRWNF